MLYAEYLNKSLLFLTVLIKFDYWLGFTYRWHEIFSWYLTPIAEGSLPACSGSPALHFTLHPPCWPARNRPTLLLPDATSESGSTVGPPYICTLYICTVSATSCFLCLCAILDIFVIFSYFSCYILFIYSHPYYICPLRISIANFPATVILLGALFFHPSKNVSSAYSSEGHQEDRHHQPPPSNRFRYL